MQTDTETIQILLSLGALLFVQPVFVCIFVLVFRSVSRKTRTPFFVTIYWSLLETFIIALVVDALQYRKAFIHVGLIMEHGKDMALFEDFLRVFACAIFTVCAFGFLLAVNYPFHYIKCKRAGTLDAANEKPFLIFYLVFLAACLSVALFNELELGNCIWCLLVDTFKS